jgi:dethiobiotin synthetase
MRKIFVTGIGTDVGKTVVSTILAEALDADYWKPVQAGDISNSDALNVQQCISNPNTVIHPETYLLSKPMSPHAAADIDGVVIDLDSFQLPTTTNSLIIEGAGGLMVPLNDTDLIIDLIQYLEVEVVLVVQNYLGSINHALLSLEVLRLKGIKILGIIFNGTTNEVSENYILNYSKVKCLGRIKQHESITKEVVLGYKNQFKEI